MDLSIERLPAAGRAEQLILLLHGWRDTGATFLPLAQALQRQLPQAAILAPDSPLAADGHSAERPRGRQWYSIEGLDGENWPRVVAQTLPPLVAWIRAQQQRLGVGPAATALGGFSQGGVLALATALAHDGLVGRVLCFGGALSAQPLAAPRETTLHLFHGEADTVFTAADARQALHWLGALDADATLDIASGVGHELHPALIDCALHRLSSYIPQRTWRAAMGAAQAAAQAAAQGEAQEGAPGPAGAAPAA